MIEKRNKLEDIYEKILLIWGYVFFSPIIFLRWLIGRSEAARKAVLKIYGWFSYYKKEG